jgi:hypothetical protein
LKNVVVGESGEIEVGEGWSSHVQCEAADSESTTFVEEIGIRGDIVRVYLSYHEWRPNTIVVSNQCLFSSHSSVLIMPSVVFVREL